jgi:hypothetical protein
LKSREQLEYEEFENDFKNISSGFVTPPAFAESEFPSRFDSRIPTPDLNASIANTLDDIFMDAQDQFEQVGVERYEEELSRMEIPMYRKYMSYYDEPSSINFKKDIKPEVFENIIMKNSVSYSRSMSMSLSMAEIRSEDIAKTHNFNLYAQRKSVEIKHDYTPQKISRMSKYISNVQCFDTSALYYDDRIFDFPESSRSDLVNEFLTLNRSFAAPTSRYGILIEPRINPPIKSHNIVRGLHLYALCTPPYKNDQSHLYPMKVSSYHTRYIILAFKTDSQDVNYCMECYKFDLMVYQLFRDFFISEEPIIVGDLKVGLSISRNLDFEYIVWYMNEVCRMGEVDTLVYLLAVYKALVLVNTYCDLSK